MTNTILNKKSIFSASDIGESFKEFGPQAFGAGAALASLAYITSQVSKNLREKKQNEEAEKGSEDVLEVEIPTIRKKASDDNEGISGGFSGHDALAVLSSVIGATLGYKGVKALTDMHQETEYKKKLDHAKKEYSEALSNSMLSSKEAMVNSFTAIDGLVDGIAKELKMDKIGGLDEFNDTIRHVFSSPLTLAALASVVAHNYVYDLEESKKQKDYKKPKPPVSIRLVSKSVDPEEEVYTEKQLQLEDKPKTATILADLSQLTEGSKEDKDPAEVQKEVQKEVEKDKKQQTEPAGGRSEDIDSNSILVHTKDGDVTVDAADKRTKELLSKNKKKLTRILASGLNSLNS